MTKKASTAPSKKQQGHLGSPTIMSGTPNYPERGQYKKYSVPTHDVLQQYSSTAVPLHTQRSIVERAGSGPMGRVQYRYIDYSRVATPPARRVGHRRPFFRRQGIGVPCGKGVEPPQGRGRPSGARESQLFVGYIITKCFQISIYVTTTTTTTEEHYIERVFSSLPSLFRFRFGHRLFHFVFSLRVLCCLFFAGSMLRLVLHMIHILIRIIRTLISPVYFCLRYTICCNHCVYYLLFFICFPPEVIFRSRVIGAYPVTTDCIVAMTQ